MRSSYLYGTCIYCLYGTCSVVSSQLEISTSEKNCHVIEWRQSNSPGYTVVYRRHIYSICNSFHYSSNKGVHRDMEYAIIIIPQSHLKFQTTIDMVGRNIYFTLRYVNTSMWSHWGYTANMTLVVTISYSHCESLRIIEITSCRSLSLRPLSIWCC